MENEKENAAAERLPNYQLGEILGKGAFGVVFKAINWTTGETVAVKQIGLANIPRSELPDIMSEINLLKNLDRRLQCLYLKAKQTDPNIVQYRGSSRTDESLFIVLEYCENGSLHGICKRFGKFPEPLVAQYICQVLEGLLYLHDQGVIHRDIKGSNILATKEGSVKLADFGVATQTGPLKDSAVVGSPYWMAPEVIDQSGATPASDIWSVGAVVIELLEGKPPYAELDPMPALFRIVNDDYPPLPESASAVAHDFLMQCFQKDYNLRISARKLLKHPWMLQARRSLDLTRREQMPRSVRPISTYDENVNQVQEWNKVLEADVPLPKATGRPKQDVAQVLQNITNVAPTRTPSELIADPVTPKKSKLQPEIEQGDNWDGDFEEGIPTTKIEAIEQDDTQPLVDDNQSTIRPKKILLPPAPKRQMETVVEDYSDLVEEDDVLAQRVASLQLNHQHKKRILHPRDLSVGSSSSVRDMSKTIKAPRTPTFPMAKAKVRHRSNSGKAPATSPLARFAEKEEESDDFSDFLHATDHQEPLSPGSLHLSTRSTTHDDPSDEEDPFAEVEMENIEGPAEDLEQNVSREKLGRMNAFVDHFVEALPNPGDMSDFEANELCGKLMLLMDECGQAEVQKAFLKDHGLLALLEALQSRRSRDLVASILRVLIAMVGESARTLEKICLMGGCPAVMAFANNKYSREIRLEAAIFIGLVCRTSLLTLQMFISCQGLKVLTGLVDESYKDQKDLIWMAIDGLLRVFEMQGSMPRNDFCRMLAHEGLLPPLANALVHCVDDKDALANTVKGKIIQIFSLFAQSDLKVREALASRAVVSRLVRCLRATKGADALSLLKTIRNMSMSPKSLDVLQNGNVIEVLVEILSRDLRSSSSTDIVNPIVNTLYNLCRLSKSRQEETAAAGAIPVLMSLVQLNSPLKQFATPILCDFAQNSKACRRLLWQHEGIGFYLELLSDPYWSAAGLESIAVWLGDETTRVEDILLSQSSIDAMLEAFVRSKAATFENLLDPLLKIFRSSPAVALATISQQAFIARLVDKVASHNKPAVRVNLLRIVKAAFDNPTASASSRLGKESELARTVDHLAASDSALLVRQLAKEIQTVIGRTPPAMKRSSSTATNLGLTARGSELIARLKKSSGDRSKLSRSSTSNSIRALRKPSS